MVSVIAWTTVSGTNCRITVTQQLRRILHPGRRGESKSAMGYPEFQGHGIIDTITVKYKLGMNSTIILLKLIFI